MASDTRLDYFNDKIISGEKYQEVYLVADCIRKTFYIDGAKIGIQFLGIGYFPDIDDKKYPLAHFIEKLRNKKYENDLQINARSIFDFLTEISIEGDTGQYIQGIMAGFNKKNEPFICTFNTYNNTFEIKEFDVGQFIDSEKNGTYFPDTDPKAIEEINKRINQKSKEKYWHIGGPVEILKINREGGVFIQENGRLFNGSQEDLLNYFNGNIEEIGGQVLKVPHCEKYTL